MATLHWWKTGVNAAWTTVTGNWWTTWDAVAKASGQAGDAPTDGDSVYIHTDESHAAPTGAFPEHEYALIDTSDAIATTVTFSSTLASVSAGGTIICGASGMTTAHAWIGDATAASIAKSYSKIPAAGAVLGNWPDGVELYGDGFYIGTIAGGAKMYGATSWTSFGGSTMGPASGVGKLIWNSTGQLGIYTDVGDGNQLYAAVLRNLDVILRSGLTIGCANAGIGLSLSSVNFIAAVSPCNLVFSNGEASTSLTIPFRGKKQWLNL